MLDQPHPSLARDGRPVGELCEKPLDLLGEHPCQDWIRVRRRKVQVPGGKEQLVVSGLEYHPGSEEPLILVEPGPCGMCESDFAELVLDFARNWAKDRGNDVLHLGGGVGSRNDSLFEFKAGFSKTRHDFVTWHLVFMPDVYDDLEKKRDSILGPAEDVGYFPAYRA